MTQLELKNKIRELVPSIYSRLQPKKDVLDSSLNNVTPTIEYDEFTKFPELKKVIVDLLTGDYHSFISSIDWVSPRPTSCRINLKNDQSFYLTYGSRSWIATISGKKYYLLNLSEEERAAKAISELLKFLPFKEKDEEIEGEDFMDDTPPPPPPMDEEPPVEED
jgi:hypothetical protein